MLPSTTYSLLTIRLVKEAERRRKKANVEIIIKQFWAWRGQIEMIDKKKYFFFGVKYFIFCLSYI